jgi:Predicted acyltransferase
MTEQTAQHLLTMDGYDFKVKAFDALSGYELKSIYQLRQQVFIIEQNCPYADIDETDLTAWHLFHKDNQVIDSYARILTDDQGDFHIGRVVVAVEFRRQGMGQALMNAALDFCRNAGQHQKIIISAQSYLSGFYRSLGFEQTGDFYLEDNIPHMRMILEPSKS